VLALFEELAAQRAPLAPGVVPGLLEALGACSAWASAPHLLAYAAGAGSPPSAAEWAGAVREAGRCAAWRPAAQLAAACAGAAAPETVAEVKALLTRAGDLEALFLLLAAERRAAGGGWPDCGRMLALLRQLQPGAGGAGGAALGVCTSAALGLLAQGGAEGLAEAVALCLQAHPPGGGGPLRHWPPAAAAPALGPAAPALELTSCDDVCEAAAVAAAWLYARAAAAARGDAPCAAAAAAAGSVLEIRVGDGRGPTPGAAAARMLLDGSLPRFLGLDAPPSAAAVAAAAALPDSLWGATDGGGGEEPAAPALPFGGVTAAVAAAAAAALPAAPPPAVDRAALLRLLTAGAPTRFFADSPDRIFVLTSDLAERVALAGWPSPEPAAGGARESGGAAAALADGPGGL